MSTPAGTVRRRRLPAHPLLGVVTVLVLTLTGLLPAPAAADVQPPAEWGESCSSAKLGLGRDHVELAPPLAGDTNPDGSRVAISADRRGKFVPVIVVHGWTSRDTHSPERDGAFSHTIDLTANRLGQVNTTRSLIGQLQRDRGVAVFTFDYRDYAASWVDDPHLGPALGKVIDCLYKASGEKVIIVGHSMGGLIARYAATQRGLTGPDRTGEISTVITFGTPETGSVAALLSNVAANSAAATSHPLAVLRLILAACGQLSSTQIKTGTLCDSLPAPVRTFDSDAGRALRAGSVQLAALRPFPAGISVDALAGGATFDLPGAGWFALPWASTRVDAGDLIVTSGSATKGATSTRKVSCAYQLNGFRGVGDTLGLAFGLVSKADVAQQPLASFSGPCFHTQLMRGIELTNEATGAVTDDISSRQPPPTRLPVRVCPTVHGDQRSAAPVPSTLPAPKGFVSRVAVSYYTSDEGYPIVLGSEGLVCSADVGGDGTADVFVGPGRGGYLSDHVSARSVPGCVGCMYDETCQVLPKEAAALRVGSPEEPCPRKYGGGSTIHRPRPGVAFVHESKNDRAPQTENDIDAVFILKTAPGEQPSEFQAECRLPAAEHALCTAILNDFATRNGS